MSEDTRSRLEIRRKDAVEKGLAVLGTAVGVKKVRAALEVAFHEGLLTAIKEDARSTRHLADACASLVTSVGQSHD